MKNKYKKPIQSTARQKEFESIKVLYESGKWAKATSEIIHYIDKYPDDMYGHYMCGKMLLKCNRYEDAQREFEIVYRSNSKNKYSGLVAMGRIEEMCGNIKVARKRYKQAINESPYFEKHAIINLAQIERKDGNYAEALEIIEQAASHTDEINILIEKARNLTLLNRIDESWEILNEIDPDNDRGIREVFLEKANVAKLKEDYDSAIELLELAKENGTKNSLYYVILFEITKINIKKEDYTSAIINCEELIDAQHYFDDEVYMMLGICQQNLRQYQKAIGSFKSALSKKDQNTYSTASYYLGTLEYVCGNKEKAEELIRESINTSISFSLSKYTKLLNILIGQKRYEEAEQILNKATEQDKNVANTKEIYIAKLLIDVGLGRKIPSERRNCYIADQIINHQDRYALEHIKRNHTKESDEKSSFNPEIDIEKLYEDIKVYLLPEHIISKGVLDDYEIDYPNIGISNGEIANKLTVMTIPGTKKIITMHPSHYDDMPRAIDIMQDKQKTIVKSNDRISKFYKRYGTSTLTDKK